MKVQIHESDLPNGKLVILIGEVESETSQICMDDIVRKYVGENGYINLIDSHLDNPLMRVVIIGFNNLEFTEHDIK